MAATTTTPKLTRSEVVRMDEDGDTFVVKTWWTARYLTTMEPVELLQEISVTKEEDLNQAWWAGTYGDFYEGWTAVTSDTTHAAVPFDVTALSDSLGP